MNKVLHASIPDDLEPYPDLPGVRPLTDGRWLRVDEAYAAQLVYRRQLIAAQRSKVLWEPPEAAAAIAELSEAVLAMLPDLGFEVSDQRVICPDGVAVDRAADSPLATLGKLVQEDLCVMEKRAEEHVLTAALLCFPASWTLAEKAGHPLSRIHQPVAEYDAQLTKRVQRLFDGVQVGRPLWRNNMLRYTDPDLHQPRLEQDPARGEPPPGPDTFIRAERQCIARLPRTKAVVFSIHSYVAPYDGRRG